MTGYETTLYEYSPAPTPREKNKAKCQLETTFQPTADLRRSCGKHHQSQAKEEHCVVCYKNSINLNDEKCAIKSGRQYLFGTFHDLILNNSKIKISLTVDRNLIEETLLVSPEINTLTGAQNIYLQHL